MKFTRITDPGISIYLLPWFVEAENEMPKEKCAEVLHMLMTETPDDTCVLVVTDKGYMKAMIQP